MKVKVRVVQKGKPLPPEKVCISTEYIRLDAFLKLANAVQTRRPCQNSDSKWRSGCEW